MTKKAQEPPAGTRTVEPVFAGAAPVSRDLTRIVLGGRAETVLAAVHAPAAPPRRVVLERPAHSLLE